MNIQGREELRAQLLGITCGVLDLLAPRRHRLRVKETSGVHVVPVGAVRPSLAHPSTPPSPVAAASALEPEVHTAVRTYMAGPFKLEAPIPRPPDGWSTLRQLSRLSTPPIAPPSDASARRVALAWCRESACADIVLLDWGSTDPLWERMVQAIEDHVCPIARLNLAERGPWSDLRNLLLHPAVRLLMISPAAWEHLPELRSGYRAEPAPVWEGKAVLLLPPVEELAADQAAKGKLWRLLQRWARPV